MLDTDGLFFLNQVGSNVSVFIFAFKICLLTQVVMLVKFDLDLPDGADDPALPPRINITLVQAESAGYEQPVRKSITINGKEYPVQLAKGNQTETAD